MAVGYMDRGEEETLMIGHGSQFTHGGMDPGTPANTTVDGRPWLRGPVLSGLQLLTLRRHRCATLSSAHCFLMTGFPLLCRLILMYGLTKSLPNGL